MKTNRFNRVISTLAIAALILIGSAPCFAFAEDEVEVTPLATFDDSKVPGTNGGSVILMNAENGDVIYEKNAHQLREPASVTKIMTCLLAVENLEMDQVITVPENVERAGTSINLVPGEELTVEQLLYGMMLKSGNDAAQVLGLAVGGDMKHFSKMMNRRAKECGAQDSVYKNPNGLNENAKTLNVTTVYDQAVITRQALKNEAFRKIVSTARYTIPKTNKSKARKLKNSNACLWADKKYVTIGDKKVPLKYSDCTGVKTGYTTAAGGCYVGSAKRGDMELIAVSFGSYGVESKFADAIALWEYGFKHYKTYTAMKADGATVEQKVKKGALAKVKIGLSEDVDITLNKNYKYEDQITTEMKLKYEEPEAPIKDGAVMGSVQVFDKDGKLIAVRDLIALEAVEEGGPLSHIGIADEYAWIFIAAIVVAILLAVFIYVRWRRDHPRSSSHRLQAFIREKTDAAKAAREAKAAKEAKAAEEAKTAETTDQYDEKEDGPAAEETVYVIPNIREITQAPQAEDAPKPRTYSVEQPFGEEKTMMEAVKEERPTDSRRTDYAPRGQRTAAEKRAIRRERAKKRKARMKEKDDVRH